MAVKFLKIKPERAYKILQDCIVNGYKTRDTIAKLNNLFISGKQEEREKKMVTLSREWVIDTVDKLKGIYPSLLQAYEFHDVGRNFEELSSLTSIFNIGSERGDFRSLIQVLNKRIDLLKEWADFLLSQPGIHISAKGDLIMQLGKENKAEIKNGH